MAYTCADQYGSPQPRVAADCPKCGCSGAVSIQYKLDFKDLVQEKNVKYYIISFKNQLYVEMIVFYWAK